MLTEDEIVKEIAADIGTCKCEDVDLDKPVLKEEEYPVWNSDNTRMISGPIGDAKYQGTRFDTWQQAETYARGKYNVVVFWTQHFRWYARIKRV